MRDFLDIAREIVNEAGLIAKQLLHDSRIIKHKDYGDIVTAGDLQVDNYVITELKKRFPDHGFDSEESGKDNENAEYVWVLDPIDGTKYYARDVPLWSISLALMQRGKTVPILGVVYFPEANRMYCASAGRGATLNDNPIYCAKEEDLEKASICVEIPSRYSPPTDIQWAMEKMSVLVSCAYRIRIIGVGSLGLCFCATGGFDAYVNIGSIWKYCDHAAGQIIVQEAGGEFSYLGKQRRDIVAGPPALCDKIKDLLNI